MERRPAAGQKRGPRPGVPPRPGRSEPVETAFATYRKARTWGVGLAIGVTYATADYALGANQVAGPARDWGGLVAAIVVGTAAVLASGRRGK